MTLPLDFYCRECFVLPGAPCTVMKEDSPRYGQPTRRAHQKRQELVRAAESPNDEDRRYVAMFTAEGIARSEQALRQAKAAHALREPRPDDPL